MEVLYHWLNGFPEKWKDEGPGTETSDDILPGYLTVSL